MDILKVIFKRQAEGCKKKPWFCISTKKGDAWKDHFFKWPNLSDLQDILDRHPTTQYNLYFCPLPFEQPHRRKEYVIGSNLLWADIDDADPKKMEPPPHILWESSPGRWAGLWMIERWLSEGELETYNKRMTYGTGSDVAGWDLTQVLRIPGTRNHKYKDSPEGKLVRVDLKSRLALKDVPENVSDAGIGKALEVYKKWEKKLKFSTRRVLTEKHVTVGKRSEVLWRLYHDLLDARVPLEEMKILVKKSNWNKYVGRRDEDKQIERDIKKCLGERPDEGVAKRENLAGLEDEYEGISANNVKCEKVDWLWYPYISKGALTIVEGDPGLGKSYFMQMVSAALCDGSAMPSPNGFGKLKQGGVYYFSIEDAPGTVIVPRLVSNGCKNLKNFRIYDRKMTMDEDGLAMAEYLVEKHKVDMVVFDTLNYFIGGIDVHRANEVSQQLEHFSRLAKNHNVAVVIVRHLTKNSTGNVKATYRGQGSIAFTGTAREVLTVGLHPDDHELKIVAVTKLNLEKLPPAIGFRITEKKGGGSSFEWEDGFFDLTSDDIIDVRPSKAGAGRPANEREDAEKFLKDMLGEGKEVEAGAVSRAAEARGISARTLARAKKEAGVKTTRRGDKWYLGL